MSKETIFNKKLIRIKSVTEITGLSKSYIYQLQNKGLFPKSVQIVPNGKATAWLLSEINQWIDSRIQERDIAQEVA